MIASITIGIISGLIVFVILGIATKNITMNKIEDKEPKKEKEVPPPLTAAQARELIESSNREQIAEYEANYNDWLKNKLRDISYTSRNSNNSTTTILHSPTGKIPVLAEAELIRLGYNVQYIMNGVTISW